MDQFVIGLALFFIGLGASSLAFKLVVGVTLQLPRVPTLSNLRIPLLGDIPIVGEILFNQNALVYFSVLISIALYYYLYQTSWGLELRAVGENPKSADSLGVNVVLMQYATTIIGSALIGVAGAYLPMVYTGVFTQGIVQGARLVGNCADVLRRLETAAHFIGRVFSSPSSKCCRFARKLWAARSRINSFAPFPISPRSS